MKHKRSVALMMAALLGTTTLVGCNGGGGGDSSVDESKTTVITTIINNTGFGTGWLKEAAARFEEANVDTEFEPGKTGVHIDVEGTTQEYVSGMGSSGYNIYFFEQKGELRDLAQGGSCLEINDVLTAKSDVRDGKEISIEEKIPEEYRIALKGRDGNYYGLPLYENLPGLSYDVDLFVKNNLYFADDSETAVTPFTSSYGNANFIANASAKKNCGNDGKYGTVDDGLPTSLQDMLILCAKMKQLGIQPITMTGMHKDYGTLLEMGLWAALAGYEEMSANYTFEGDVEVITGWTNEPLFQGDGLSGIKKPITETVTVTEETGYKVYDSAARYYAMAFIQAIQTLGWFSKDSESATVSHTDAQAKFIFGGTYTNPKLGMIIEGVYWWNETEEKAANLSTYFKETGKTERNIAMMSLPTSLNGPRPQEGVENDYAFIDIGASYCAINSNIAENTNLVNACKEFLKFLYTDAELQAFTEALSVNKALIQYPISDASYENMDTYTKSVQDLTRRSSRSATNGNVVYVTADNPTYLANAGTFNLYKGAPVLRVTLNKVQYSSHLHAMRGAHSLVDIFNATRLSESAWTSYYQGE